MAIRAHPKEPSASTIPYLVVATCSSRRISPSLPIMQYRLVLSPRSIPNRDAFLGPFSLHPWLLTLLSAATLLHGRSPLHFEYVCGSLSHPGDAGLLIPSRTRRTVRVADDPLEGGHGSTSVVSAFPSKCPLGRSTLADYRAQPARSDPISRMVKEPSSHPFSEYLSVLSQFPPGFPMKAKDVRREISKGKLRRRLYDSVREAG
jgi:hypothetical protein